MRSHTQNVLRMSILNFNFSINLEVTPKLTAILKIPPLQIIQSISGRFISLYFMCWKRRKQLRVCATCISMSHIRKCHFGGDILSFISSTEQYNFLVCGTWAFLHISSYFVSCQIFLSTFTFTVDLKYNVSVLESQVNLRPTLEVNRSHAKIARYLENNLFRRIKF